MGLAPKRAIHWTLGVCSLALLTSPALSAPVHPNSPSPIMAETLGISEALGVPAAPVLTQHSIPIGQNGFAYQAEVGRVAIRDFETARPRGYMGYIAYKADTTEAEAQKRPIIFVWNGGPGSNSATLHFETAGPLRSEGGGLVPNQETWLTSADLVFVDPIGTGFSRPAGADDADQFYSTLGDVASVSEFVRSWLYLHGQEDRPIILAGESWGAGRAANVGYRLISQGLPIKALVLISGGDGLNTRYLSEAHARAAHVIDLAPMTQFHGKLPPELGPTPQEAARKAAAWSQTTYLPALQNLETLSGTERTAIIRDLSRFTGLPADLIDPITLSFTPRQHLRGLLQAEGKTLNIFDMRLTQEPENHSRAAIERYLRHDLGYTTDLAYVGLSARNIGYAPFDRYPQSVGTRWNYATIEATPEIIAAAIREAVERGGGPPRIGPPLPGTEEALALQPQLRVLVASGQYDSLASCAGNEALALRLPEPLKASLSFRCYAGGHMFYRSQAVRAQFAEDIAVLASDAARP